MTHSNRTPLDSMRVWDSNVILLGRSMVVWLLSGIDFVLVFLAELLLLLVAMLYVLSRAVEALIAFAVCDFPYRGSRTTYGPRRTYVRTPSLWYASLPIVCLRKWTDYLSGRAHPNPSLLKDESSQTDHEPPVWEYRVCPECENYLQREYLTRNSFVSALPSRSASPDSVVYRDRLDVERKGRVSTITDEGISDHDTRLSRRYRTTSSSRRRTPSVRHLPLKRRQISRAVSPMKASLSSRAYPTARPCPELAWLKE